jgi:hypothetical protein
MPGNERRRPARGGVAVTMSMSVPSRRREHSHPAAPRHRIRPPLARALRGTLLATDHADRLGETLLEASCRARRNRGLSALLDEAALSLDDLAHEIDGIGLALVQVQILTGDCP